MPKSYCFNIMQYERHPLTGEVLLTEEQIKKCIAHKTLGKWAYVCHDKDVYSEKDELDDPEHKTAGEPKPRHWHIVLRTKTNQLEIEVIAKWLGISENFVEIKSASAFLDCVEYLTHEHQNQQELGKHLYDDEEIIANFDFRGLLDQRKENSIKYGRADISKKDQWIHDLNQGKKTLRQCYMEDPILYGNSEELLRRNRRIFLQMQKPPLTRTNVYIGARRKDGTSGGMGKSLASRAVARQMGRSLGFIDFEDDDLFFIVGAKNVTFEGYDGQPIIIWDDCKAINILEKLGSRENVYNVFDTYPAPVTQRQNVKGSFVPMNQVCNIISSSQEPFEFLDGLAGEFTNKSGQTFKADDKSQIYRRINIYLFLHEEDFEIGFNKGYFNDNNNYMEYEQYKGITGNFQIVRRELQDAQARQIEMQMTRRIGEKVEEKMRHDAEQKEKNKDKVLDFSMYGMTQDEVREKFEKTTEELRELQDGLASGKYQFRDDITQEEIEKSKNDFIDIMAQFYGALEQSGQLDAFNDYVKKRAKDRTIDEYYKRHENDADIVPVGSEYENEIQQIELDLHSMTYDIMDKAQQRFKENK